MIFVDSDLSGAEDGQKISPSIHHMTPPGLQTAIRFPATGSPPSYELKGSPIWAYAVMKTVCHKRLKSVSAQWTTVSF